MGYVGSDCNTCDSDYYVSFNFNGENTCEGEWKNLINKIQFI